LILRLQLLGHHLDDRDIVALRFGAVSPQTLARRPQEAFRAAKLREELFQEYFEPFPVCGLSSAGFFRQKDLNEVGRGAHDVLAVRSCLASFQVANPS
jgi:hypothetical protein